MKKLIFLLLCFISIKTFGQVVKPDHVVTPNGPNTQVYWNVKLKTLILPHFDIGSPPVYQDTVGAFFLNTDTTDNHIYVRYKMGTGGLMALANLRDITTGLPDQTGQGGNFLSTDGSSPFWTTIPGGVSTVFGRTGNVVATSGDYNTSLVTENTNLYFTNARVLTAPLTGYTSGAGTVAGTDNILQAFQKINGNEVLDAANIATNTTAISGKAPTFTVTAPITYISNVIAITQADATHNGYVSSADWSTFNGKQAALGFTPYNSTNPSNYIALSAISATSPIFYNSSTGVISSQSASGSQNGYLLNTDWTTFNGKQGLLTFDSTPTGSSTNPVTSGGVFTALAGKVPTTRTLTINGTPLDLSADRSWTISGGTPGGSTTQVQYNNSGAFGGDSNFIWENTLKSMGLGGSPTAKRLSLIGAPYTPVYAFGSYWSFGDSITAGTGSTGSNAYVLLLGTQIGLTVHNKSLGGSMAADQADSVYSVTPGTTSQLYTYMIGTNDVGRYSTANQALTWQLITAAEDAYLAIPNANKITGQGGSVTYGGTWTNGTFYGGSLGKVSQTNGSTATFSVTGTTVYVAYTMQDSNTGTFTMTVDGVSQGTFTAAGVSGATINTVNSRAYADGLIRVAGLSNTSHTIILTVTSSTSSSNKVYFDWAAGNNGAGTTGWPMVVHGGIYFNTNAQIPTYSQYASQNVANLKADGLNVYYAETTAQTENIALYLSGDNLHPNNAGHAALYTAFLNQIDGVVNPALNTSNVANSSGAILNTVSYAGFQGIGSKNPVSPSTVQAPSAIYDAATSTVPLASYASYFSSGGIKTLELRLQPLNVAIWGLGSGVNLGTTPHDINSFGANNLNGLSNTGYYINALGTQILQKNTTGHNLNAMGQGALQNNTTGNDNNAFGQQALNGNNTGHDINAFGNSAMVGATGTNYNINAFGQGAAYGNGANGAFDLNAFGQQTLLSITTAHDVDAIGQQAGNKTTTGYHDVFLNYLSGYNNTTGYENFFGGGYSGYHNTTGHDNVAIGEQAMYNGTTNMTTNTNSLFLGAFSTGNVNALTNAAAIGYQANVLQSNQMVYGNTSVTSQIFNGAILENASTTAVNATATLTAAQMQAAYITTTSAATETLTTPTATALATLMGAKRGSHYEFTIDNTVGANTVTLALDASFTLLNDITGSTTLTVVSGTAGVATWRITFVSTTAAVISRIQ